MGVLYYLSIINKETKQKLIGFYLDRELETINGEETKED